MLFQNSSTTCSKQINKDVEASLPQKLFLISILGFFLFLLSSCGKNAENPIVKDVKIQARLGEAPGEEGDVLLDVGAIFNLGNLQMTSIVLPIVDPIDPALKYGELRFLGTLDGMTEIGGVVNLTNSAKVKGGVARLPNGEQLPVGGIDGVDIIELRLEEIHSRIYLSLDHNATMFGFAISIKEFNRLSEYVGSFNLFPGFNIQGVRGNVGVFTGNEEYQSGLGFFLDISKIINTDILNDIISGNKLDQEEFAKVLESKSTITSTLNFDVKSSSVKKEKKLKEALYKMSNGKKMKLNYVQD